MKYRRALLLDCLRRTMRSTTLDHRVVALFFGLIFAAVIQPASARQAQRFWIAFKDKPAADLSHLDPLSLGISEHALWRRAKVLPPDRLLDELDLPVNQAYVDQLRSSGIVIRSTSRWLNAVSAELTPSQQISLASVPFVATVRPVAVYIRHDQPPTQLPAGSGLQKVESVSGLNYGQSFTQLNNIKVIDVHNKGITGAGVIIGMLDDGFNQHTVHPALKNIKVIAEYDFVQRDSNTSRAPGEYAGQGNHGAGTLSAIGGFDNGNLIGAAFGASFILAKTEVDSTETQIEESYWVEGLEWEERLGAEVVSSSLGYIDWYKYPDLNGQTATTTKAAKIAARKGVLVVNAMGNEGNYQKDSLGRFTTFTGTMIVPADADSMISVGATNSSGVLAGFSSTGPTFDGRVKPEVVAQGVSDWVMYGELGYQGASGTSFSTPLTAGVAALVFSANPTLTPMQVRDRLMSNATPLYDAAAGMTSHPNNFYGWGMVDAAKAVGISTGTGGSGSGLLPGQIVLHNNYPNPFNGSTTITVEAGGVQDIELSIYNLLGQHVRTLYKGKSSAGFSYFPWQDGLDDAGRQVTSGVYVCRLKAASLLLSQKLLYLK